MIKIRPGIKVDYILVSIFLAAAFLRFYGLTRESLWIDELITMMEVDPVIHWGQMFDLLGLADPHPPLFFILERITCTVFGHTETAARGLNAVLGSLSVVFIYHLGKEILNKRLGYTAAILLCVNYYSLYYSQEARDYALALCNSILSTLFFVKLVKRPYYLKSALYALFALLLLYTHYFGLFIVASQGLLVVALLLSKRGLQKESFRFFYAAAALILIGYVPWLPSFFTQLSVTSFWIPPVPGNFAITYFFEYFGNAAVLEPILILLLLYYTWHAFTSQPLSETKKVMEDPLLFSFLVISFTIVITLYIPYLRSVWVVPMLVTRYTIVLLPLYILAIAYGITLINSSKIQVGIVAIIVVLSLTHIFFVKRFYSPQTVGKTQFREVTQFMKEVGGAYPLVENGSTVWPHGYYLHKYNYYLPRFWGFDYVDSILHNPSPRYKTDGFWLVGAAPNEGHLAPHVQKEVDSLFTLVSEKNAFQSWAQLYVRKTGSWNAIYLSPYDFTQQVVLHLNFDVLAPIEDSLESKPITLKSGKYKIIMNQSGVKVNALSPHIALYLLDQKIGEVTCPEYPNFDPTELIFSVDAPVTSKLKLKMVQPADSDEKGIGYVHFITIIPMVN